MREITVKDRLISIREVERLVGLKQSAIYDRISKSQFPPSRSLGLRTIRWLESEVEAWVHELPIAPAHEAVRR